MTKKTFSLVLVVITVLALVFALLLTSASIRISNNKASNRAKSEVLGTWTELQNPQIIIQFTSDNEYKVLGETKANYHINADDHVITLSYNDGTGDVQYAYSLSENASQLTLDNLLTGESISYTR